MTVKLDSTTDSPEAVTAAMAPPVKVEKPAEVESPVVEAASTETVDKPPESAPAKPAEVVPPKKNKGGFQKKIDKLTRANADTTRERDYWREQALKGKTPEQPTTATAEVFADDPKPNVEKFETHADYIEALTDWKVRTAQRTEQEKAKKVERDAEHSKRLDSWNVKLEKAREVHDDFDSVMSESVPVSPVMSEAMLTSDFGAELAYHFGKNPDVAKRIFELPPVAAAREIGKIETQLEKAAAPSSGEAAPTPTTKTTVKPKPPTPVAGQATQTTTKPLDELPYQEYKKAREKQLRNRSN
jgi:hypothetical protein